MEPTIDVRDARDRPLGALVAEATSELTTLVRQEIALAKAEVRQDVRAVAVGAGAFGAAGVTALLAVVVLTFALVFGLDAAGLPLWSAALAVGVGYLVLAGVLAMLGKSRISSAPGLPRTVRTIKDDVEWAKHPGSA